MNPGPQYQIIAASIISFAGFFSVFWGPDHFRRAVRAGRLSPEEARAKIVKVKIYGWAMILCGTALYLIRF